MAGDRTILWRRLDQPGHESARLFHRDEHWHLMGTAVFTHDEQPCRLDYRVVCDRGWHTASASVQGWVGKADVDVELSVDPAGVWNLNGLRASEVDGCLDVDLNFSPSTNLLPIRRLGLNVGQESAVRAAWLRFPAFKLEPLDQTYRRIDQRRYRYESAGGRFVGELDVDEAGLVIRYHDIWQAEAST